jgi:glutathione S-transferase
MIKLHNFERSPFGWKTRIVLAEKKVPYAMVVPTNKSEDPAFALLNPFRLTPVLELDNGRTVYESTVINEFLEETFPDPPMLPRDPYERARVRMLEDSTDQYLMPAVRALRESQFDFEAPFLIRKKPERIDEKVVAEARARVLGHLDRLEGQLRGQPWFGGEIFSLADATLVPPLMMSLPVMGVLPDARYPELENRRRRVAERPSYLASRPKEPLRLKE